MILGRVKSSTWRQVVLALPVWTQNWSGVVTFSIRREKAPSLSRKQALRKVPEPSRVSSQTGASTSPPLIRTDSSKVSP